MSVNIELKPVGSDAAHPGSTLEARQRGRGENSAACGRHTATRPTMLTWDRDSLGREKVSPPLRADRSSTGLTEPSSSSLDSPGKFTFPFGRGNYYRRTTNGTLYYLQVDGVYGHAGRGLPSQFHR